MLLIDVMVFFFLFPMLAVKVVWKNFRSDVMARIEKKLDDTNDYVRRISPSQTIEQTLTSIEEKLSETNDYLCKILDEFTGFKKNVVKGIEIELMKAAELFILQQGFTLDGKPRPGDRIRDGNNQIIAEVDGLLYFRVNDARHAALVEAKNKVEKKAILQVKHAANVLQEREQLGGILHFIGGPLLDENTKAGLLNRNIIVLEVSGTKYHAIVPDGADGRIVPLSRTLAA